MAAYAFKAFMEHGNHRKSCGIDIFGDRCTCGYLEAWNALPKLAVKLSVKAWPWVC